MINLEYIRTLKSLLSDFIRDRQPEDVSYYQEVYDWLDSLPVASLQQEQPEVELGEITPSFAENMLCEFGVQSIDDMDSEVLAEFARHFWNKGFNARKEE